MLSFFSRIGKRRQATLPCAAPPVPYEVACACGYLLRGYRQLEYQAPKCPACGRKVFILPQSCLPPLASLDHVSPTTPAVRLSVRSTRKLLLASYFALAFVGLSLIGLIFLRVERPSPVHESYLAEQREILGDHIRAGQRAWIDGNLQLAAEQFHQAAGLRARYPAVLSGQENRELTQLVHQATLLADLLRQPLEEILCGLNERPEREGQAVFERHYRGKGVIFYAQVRRNAGGRYHTDYCLFDGRQQARLELGNLLLLQKLPLHDPQQMLFGARLAGVHREAVGGWVVSLVPDSGVLLTDPRAAAACRSLPMDDEQFQEVLARQAAWLTNLP